MTSKFVRCVVAAVTSATLSACDRPVTKAESADRPKASYASAVRCLWLADEVTYQASQPLIDQAKRVKISAAAVAYQMADGAGRAPSSIAEDLTAMTAAESARRPPSPIECDAYTFGGPPAEPTQACQEASAKRQPEWDAIFAAEKAEFAANCSGFLK